jgi:hypothetical protein
MDRMILYVYFLLNEDSNESEDAIKKGLLENTVIDVLNNNLMPYGAYNFSIIILMEDFIPYLQILVREINHLPRANCYCSLDNIHDTGIYPRKRKLKRNRPNIVN